jgi:hypothetical protein
MAITITSTLPAEVAALVPVIIEGTTDRWPFNGTVRYSKTDIGLGTAAIAGAQDQELGLGDDWR